MRSFVLLVVFSFLPCSRRLLRRLAAVFGGAAGARMSAQFLPVILAHVYAIILGGFPDVGEGQFAVFVGNADRLVETGDSVSDMARVGHRLLALFWEGEQAPRKSASINSDEETMTQQLAATSAALVGIGPGTNLRA